MVIRTTSPMAKPTCRSGKKIQTRMPGRRNSTHKTRHMKSTFCGFRGSLAHRGFAGSSSLVHPSFNSSISHSCSFQFSHVRSGVEQKKVAAKLPSTRPSMRPSPRACKTGTRENIVGHKNGMASSEPPIFILFLFPYQTNQIPCSFSEEQ